MKFQDDSSKHTDARAETIIRGSQWGTFEINEILAKKSVISKI